MPTRPPSVCAEPGCPTLTRDRRCAQHQPTDTRPSAARRGYDRAHRQRRARYLAQHPTCECAGCNRCTPNGCTKPSTDLDHRDGNPRNNDPSNHNALCGSCHSAKTAMHDGSFGRPRANRHGDGMRDGDDEPPPPTLPVFA